MQHRTLFSGIRASGRSCSAMGAAVACLLLAGCQFLPEGQVGTLETQNRILMEQNKAQLAEIENLKVHGHDVESRLLQAQDELAVLEERGQIDRQRLANFQQERDRLDQWERLRSMPATASERHP